MLLLWGILALLLLDIHNHFIPVSYIQCKGLKAKLKTQSCNIATLRNCNTAPLQHSNKQAGAELGQAQLKLGLDLTLIFYRFGLVELVRCILFGSFD